MECIDVHVFRRVWSWYVVTNGRVEALRVWASFVDPEWLLSSCAATDGDGRVGPACPCRVCASSWWFGCSVSVCVGVVVWWSASFRWESESPSRRALTSRRAERAELLSSWLRTEAETEVTTGQLLHHRTLLIRTETRQSQRTKTLEIYVVKYSDGSF